MKFTNRYLKSLEPAAKRYSKTEDGGLTIRVNPSGQKSWPEDERLLNREGVPRIGKYKLPEVARKNLVNLLDPIRARGAEVQANRTLAVVSISSRGLRDRSVVPSG